MHSKVRQLKILEGQINYEVTTGKKYILFLHGSNNNLTMFNEYRKFFDKRGIGSIAIDLRGDGKSTGSMDVSFYDIDNYCLDIEQIMKKENVDKISLVGFSIGGLVAQHFAATRPKKTEKIVLISSSYDVNKTFCTTKPRKIFFIASTILKKAFISYNKIKQRFGTTNKLFYPNYSSEEVKQKSDFSYLMMFYGNHPTNYLQRALQFSKNARKWNTEEDTKKIQCPTLIVQGNKDRLIPKQTAYQLEKMIKTSGKPIIIQEGTHSMIYKKANQIVNKISEFLIN